MKCICQTLRRATSLLRLGPPDMWAPPQVSHDPGWGCSLTVWRSFDPLNHSSPRSTAVLSQELRAPVLLLWFLTVSWLHGFFLLLMLPRECWCRWIETSVKWCVRRGGAGHVHMPWEGMNGNCLPSISSTAVLIFRKRSYHLGVVSFKQKIKEVWISEVAWTVLRNRHSGCSWFGVNRHNPFRGQLAESHLKERSCGLCAYALARPCFTSLVSMSSLVLMSLCWHLYVCQSLTLDHVHTPRLVLGVKPPDLLAQLHASGTPLLSLWKLSLGWRNVAELRSFWDFLCMQEVSQPSGLSWRVHWVVLRAICIFTRLALRTSISRLKLWPTE